MQGILGMNQELVEKGRIERKKIFRKFDGIECSLLGEQSV